MKKVISKVMVAVLVTTMVSAPIYKNVYAETQTMSTITAETEKSSVAESIFKTANYYAAQESLSEWQIPAMVRTGKITEVQKEKALEKVKENIQNGYEYSSQMAKDIFVLSALGENPQEFCDYDLVNEMIGKGDYIGSCNYEVWILSAASKGNYTIDDDNKEKLETIYEDILACQSEDGGFAYYPGGSWIDVDMTGMALYAIASYGKNDDKTLEVINKAKDYINNNKDAEGKFNNSNTTAMAILGLSSIGEDVSSLVEDILTYQMEDGQFKWIHEEAEGNYLATEQDFYALVQSEAAKNGADLFDFRNDWKLEETPTIITPPEEEKPSEDVSSETKTPETVTPETTTPNKEENSKGDDKVQNNNSSNNSSAINNSSSSTKTGDNNNAGLFFGISLISMLGLAILAPKKKERGNGER
ncbi:MAG: prenyltransferase/squalene oxidase repeat-containing protein [Clostridium sp.]